MSALAFPHAELRAGANAGTRRGRAARRRHLSAVPGGRAGVARPVTRVVSAHPTVGSSAVALVPSPAALVGPLAPAPTRRLAPALPDLTSAPALAPVPAPLARPERDGAPVRPVRRPVRRSDALPGETVEPARTAVDAPLRLTVRGRRVLVVLGLVIAAALGSVLGLAFPSEPAAPTEVATVVVSPGESLWAIAAEHAAPGADVRVVVDQIMELNSLATSTVVAGQALTVPVG
ncbi:LysM peptidoglycan-binding domain-containing protein [Occultella kanbiaonis]|uniref:LysM peptidoglycan-binding domain-containing protein n=1 Tax=Occultella kanbiaonis TaxID=2675754 RepID=UPI0013D40EFB|nr:LysM peptidoglycan-binding domain-containing protein [Occultella kanbiaonis]